MNESSSDQAILTQAREREWLQGWVEGWIEGWFIEARTMLFRIGRKRFGDPGLAVRRFIGGISDLEQLEQLTERVVDVQSWQELVDDSSAP